MVDGRHQIGKNTVELLLLAFGHWATSDSVDDCRTGVYRHDNTPTRASGFQPIACAEYPGNKHQAQSQKEQGHAQAHIYVDIGNTVKAPAESADQIDYRVEQGNGLPEGRQHVDGVKAATQESQGRDDQQGYDLQLFEAIGPDADDEAEQTEGQRSHQDRKSTRLNSSH